MSQKVFIDFPAIREAISIEKAATFVGLPSFTGDQLRCACPACQTTDTRALVVTKSKAAYYCFGDKRGGDAIGLVAHIKGIGQRDAAILLQQAFLREPEKPKQKQKRKAPRRTIEAPASEEYSIVDHLEKMGW